MMPCIPVVCCWRLLALSGGRGNGGARLVVVRGAPAQVQQREAAFVGQPLQLHALSVQGSRHLLGCSQQGVSQRNQESVNLPNAAEHQEGRLKAAERPWGRCPAGCSTS